MRTFTIVLSLGPEFTKVEGKLKMMIADVPYSIHIKSHKVHTRDRSTTMNMYKNIAATRTQWSVVGLLILLDFIEIINEFRTSRRDVIMNDGRVQVTTEQLVGQRQKAEDARMKFR